MLLKPHPPAKCCHVTQKPANQVLTTIAGIFILFLFFFYSFPHETGLKSEHDL